MALADVQADLATVGATQTAEAAAISGLGTAFLTLVSNINALPAGGASANDIANLKATADGLVSGEQGNLSALQSFAAQLAAEVTATAPAAAPVDPNAPVAPTS